jgi:Tol biopolymer transport system component
MRCLCALLLVVLAASVTPMVWAEGLENSRLYLPLLYRPSPPARGQIVFVSNRDGNDEVYRINADGTGLQNLTRNPADDSSPAWSPDGAQIAFVPYRDGNQEIYRMQADGSSQANLTCQPGDDKNPAWSPDGRKIAFLSNRDGNWEVYVMNTDGSGQTNLSHSLGDERGLAWSPDGQRIVFADGLGLRIVSLDGTEDVSLVNGEGHFWYWSPAWSPDGSRIAFVTRFITMHAYAFLDVIGVDGLQGRSLLSSWMTLEGLTWSPDGSQIACVASVPAQQIVLVATDGSTWTDLTQDAAFHIYEQPVWSPDGRMLAFSSDRDANQEIYVISAEGTDLARLTDSPAVDRQPAWRPLLPTAD